MKSSKPSSIKILEMFILPFVKKILLIKMASTEHNTGVTAATQSKTNEKYPLSAHPNDGKSQYGGSRDLVGYGSKPPNPKWPNNAKLCLNFVLNYEEGGENCLLHGDTESEKLLSEIVGAGAIGTCE